MRCSCHWRRRRWVASGNCCRRGWVISHSCLKLVPRRAGVSPWLSARLLVPGTDEQKAAGIKDSPDLCYNDLIRVCEADPEIARAFVDNVLDIYKILKEEGIVWPGLVDLPGQSATRGLGWLLGYGPKIVACFQKRLTSLAFRPSTSIAVTG